MSRFRVTVRGDFMELRGYVDGQANLSDLAECMQERFDDTVMVVASPVDETYNPFRREGL